MNPDCAEQLCRRCGQAMRAELPAGLCPGCLLLAGLAGVAGAAGTASAHAEPPGMVPLSLADFPRPFGDYELLEELARGGMGMVFKARQISLNRLVAVKLIATGRRTPDAIARFRLEAGAAARL